MKKISTLLLLLILLVNGAQAQFTKTDFATAGISQDKVYTIATSERGAFSSDANGLKRVATTDATDANQLFAFVNDPKDATKTYLYSVGQQKFITDKVAWTVESPSPIYLFNVDYATYNHGLSFSNNYTTKNLMINGSNAVVADLTWGTPDVGDRLLIQEASYAGYNVTDAQAILTSKIVNVTYKVVDAQGNELISTTTKQVDGHAAEAPSAILNDFVTLTNPTPATVSENATITYTATINLPYKPYNSADESTWYLVKMRDSKYWKYGNAAPYQVVSEGDPTLTLTDDDKWAFTGNPYKVEVLNHKAGDSKRLNSTETPQLADRDATGNSSYWVLVKSTVNNDNGKGFLLKKYNEGQYLNDNGGTLKYWSQGAADAGSKIIVMGVDELKEAARTTITNYNKTVPTLFTEDIKTTANNAIDNATSMTAVRKALTDFFGSANGKRVTIHTGSKSNRNSTYRGYLSDRNPNGSQLTKDASYDYEIAFDLGYKTSEENNYNIGNTHAFSLRNVVSGRYVQDVTQSDPVTTGTEPKYFNILLVDGGVAIGQSGDNTFLHNADDGRVVGWSSTENNSQWTLALFDNAQVDKTSCLENIDQHVATNGSPRWGDAQPTDAFTKARQTYVDNPSYENYQAALDTKNGLKPIGSETFVNIASQDVSGYSIGLSSGKESNSIHGQTTNLNDADQLWLVESEKLGTVRLYNPNAKKYIGALASGSAVTTPLSDTPVDWSINWNTDGSFTLQTVDGTATQYLRFETGSNDNYGNLNGWSDNKNWKYTAVTTLSIKTHAVGDKTYATIAYPFSVTMDKGEGYKATLNDEETQLALTSAGKTIAAGEPVIVVANAADDADNTITLTINGTEKGEASTDGTNQLKAQLLPTTIAANGVYTLGQKDNQIGFYHWAGTLQNKAYFSKDGVAAKGLTFDFDTPTGINETVKDIATDSNTPRYNLAGQRVDKAYKGVVIVKGKKMLQK